MQIISQSYRIYPNEKQKQTINQWLGNARAVWNIMLRMNIEHYQETKKFVFEFEMNKKLPILKRQEKTEWLKKSPSQTLQQKCQDLDTAIKRSIKDGFGFPNFKSKHSDESGIRFPQYWNIKKNKLNLPKLSGIKIVKHRNISGKTGQLTLKRDRAGAYFVTICYEVEEFKAPAKEIKNSVGIDVGLSKFATLSDGSSIDNPKFLTKSEERIKKRQRELSRKAKGSNNRAKARLRMALAHKKIKNQRNNFIKQVANSIAKSYDCVSVEDLSIKEMMQNPILAKAIGDVSWHQFLTELEWQCKKHSTHFVKIDKYYPSSKTCSSCGWKNDKLTLADRTFKCKQCEIATDRDLNAALNINRVGTTRINA